MKRNNGFILLLVIAVLTAASATLALASLSARQNARGIRVSIDLAQISAAHDAVLARAILGLNQSVPLYADGRAYDFSIADINLTYRLINVRGLIDLNTANEELLSALFSELQLSRPEAEALAAAIADWRDTDNTARNNGGEKPAYQNANLQGPGNRPFVDVSELRGVLGMDASLYHAAAPFLTTHSTMEKPDAQIAPPLVLGLLSLSNAERNDILDRRRAGEQPSQADTKSSARTKAGKDAAVIGGTYILLIEATQPGGTQQALRLVFSTGPRPGEYAILSRRPLSMGAAAQLYGQKLQDVTF